MNEQTKNINDLRASFLNADGKKINMNKVFEYVKEHEHIKIWKRTPYIYEDGRYVEDADGIRPGARIKSKIMDLILPDFRTPEIVSRIYRRIEDDAAFMLTEDEKQPATWINFRNAFFDAATGEFHEHTPDVFSLNQLPFEYDPNEQTSGPATEEFLRFALYREGALELFLEFVGLAMTTDTGWQKFLLLTGQGGNGKSVLIDMIENVIGSENVSRLSMDDLEQRFAKAEVLGKLANLCADLKTGDRKDVANFKQFTGGDELRAENKGVRGFKFRPYASNVFSSNAVPRLVGEESDAIYRRMLILLIDRKPVEPDIRLPEKLKAERKHFLHMCVDALRRLYARGAFVECPSSTTMVEDAKKDNNSTDAFLSDLCETGTTDGHWTNRTTLYDAYRNYCEEEGRIPKSNTEFYKTLRNKGFQDGKRRGVRGIRGLRISEEKLAERIREQAEARGEKVEDVSLPTFEEPTPEQLNMFEEKQEKKPDLAEIAKGIQQIQKWIEMTTSLLADAQ